MTLDYFALRLWLGVFVGKIQDLALRCFGCSFYAYGERHSECTYFFLYEQVTKLPFKDKCNVDYFSSGYKEMVSSEESPRYHHFCLNLDGTSDPDMDVYGNPNDCVTGTESSWYFIGLN